jgi:uncharacterized LabA/DUF88 family protein
MADRAIVFIDGNNWYHSLRDLAVSDLGRLSYARISEKLLGPRDWTATRYYIGQVQQADNTRLYAEQRRFISTLEATDRRISCHFGRLELRSVASECAEELLQYLNSMPVRIDVAVYQELVRLAHRHRKARVFVEKAVDVMLACDVVSLAERNAYDAAYLLTADGDFTPAAEIARRLGKKVYAVSPSSGARLAAATNSFIKVDRRWFDDCYK